MSDENFTGVRATTADEEAVMFRKSWIKAERENAALRIENARLREALAGLQETIARKYDIMQDVEVQK